jgi:hypothetical protein
MSSNTRHHWGDGPVWLDPLIMLTAGRETIRLSFDLGVLAIDGWTDVSEVAALVDRCQSPVHVEGELDERIDGTVTARPSKQPCATKASSTPRPSRSI